MAAPELPHIQDLKLPPHILYQNSSRTITVIDIPRSIEDAQYLSSFSKDQSLQLKTGNKLISCKPVETPYPSLEPKSAKALRNAREKSIQELMLERWVQLALDEMMGDYGLEGVMCLERVFAEDEDEDGDGDSTKKKGKGKRKREWGVEEEKEKEIEKSQKKALKVENTSIFPKWVEVNGVTGTMPPKSMMLYGDISEGNTDVDWEEVEKFQVIVADPPWPNRSALRKDAYITASGAVGIEGLLRALPIHHLQLNGYLGIWITNKTLFRSMLLDPGGFFDYWGLELVEEWIWLKVTRGGEPIYDINGTWRKPWEILLVGRKRERGVEREEGEEGKMPKRRILVGVPDLHSRKPNLRFLFGQLLGLEDSSREDLKGDSSKQDYDYRGLEIFARNLTAGWWGLGNEVLKFQGKGAWVGGEGEGEVEVNEVIALGDDGGTREIGEKGEEVVVVGAEDGVSIEGESVKGQS